jgi:HK97 gp10 family phage protein
MGGVSFTNLIPSVITTLANASDATVVEACLQIQAMAKQMAPVDTSFLQSSIYTETSKGSTYGEGMEAPPGDAYALDDIGAPPDSHTGYVAVAANYGIYQEFGTRKMGAQPYLIPAAESVRSAFEGGTLLTQALGSEGL